MDGQGQSGVFSVLETAKNKVILQAESIKKHKRPIPNIFLAPAYTKATRRSWLLEKSVELEATGIWFWQAEHSQIKVPDEGKENWTDQLIAGAKQCSNNFLPEIKTFASGAEALIKASSGIANRYLLWEDAPLHQVLTNQDLQQDGDILFVMGPEGGLSKREANLFIQNGFKAFSLGKSILRWETAAILALGLAWWAREVKNAPKV